MTGDIVTRLREWAWQTERYTTAKTAALTLTEAADEIERLRVIVDGVDSMHCSIVHRRSMMSICRYCREFWPCPTRLLIHPEEARREQ